MGFFSNPFYKYFHIKLFWRNRYVLFLVFLIIALNAIIWFIWLEKFLFSGFIFDIPQTLHFDIKFIPKLFVLPFLNSFISCLNLFLSFIIYKKSSLSAFFLIGCAIFINLSVLAVASFYIFSLGL